jgi:hypothetical protein
MRILLSPEPRTQLRGEKVFILFDKVFSNVVWSATCGGTVVLWPT